MEKVARSGHSYSIVDGQRSTGRNGCHGPEVALFVRRHGWRWFCSITKGSLQVGVVLEKEIVD